MKNWQTKILQIALGIATCVLGCHVCQRLHLPLLGNQYAVLKASYYMGPGYAFLIAIISGIINTKLGIAGGIYVVPALVGSVLSYVLAAYRPFLKKHSHTISAACIIGLSEGIALSIALGISMQQGMTSTTGILTVTDDLMAMMKNEDYPIWVCCLFVGIFAVYMDVTIDLLLMKIGYFIKNPLKKRRAHKQYLKRNMTMTGALLIGVTLALFAPALSPLQVQAKESVNYIQKIYNVKNGLAGGAANDLVQSDDGTMWVATYEGLYRFNGSKFELVTDIPGVRSVMCLCVGSDGSLWIGNNGTGLVVKTPSGKVLSLDVYGGMPSDGIRSIAQLSDTIYYVATASGVAVVEYDGEQLIIQKVLNENQYINQIRISRDGIIAYYSSDRMVYLAKNGEIIQSIEFSDKDISSVSFDQYGSLYVGVTGNKLAVFAKSGDNYRRMGNLKTGDLMPVTQMLFADGITYVAAQNGLGYLNESKELIPIYVDGFDSNISKILLDYQGNVWFSSSRNGILCLEKSVFSDAFTTCDVSPRVVNTEVMWQGLLYVGTDSGLLALDLSQAKNITNTLTEKFGAETRIRCLRVDSNNSLWISEYNSGSYEVTADGEIYEYTGVDSGLQIGKKARFSMELSDHSVLLSNNGGIAFVKDHQIIDQKICGDTMCSAYALSALELEDGTLLIGTDGEGIQVMVNGEVTRTITRQDGISSGVILRMVDDTNSDGVYVLTGSGLCYVHGDYTAEEVTGFPYYNNLDMWMTQSGSSFIFSSAGLFVCDSATMRSAEVNSYLLDYTMGLRSNLTSNAWNYLDENGRLYLASNTGVYILDTNHYRLVVSEYNPMIVSATLDGQTTNIEEDVIRVPSGEHTLELDLDISNFTSVNPYVRYYLSGVDAEKTVVSAENLTGVTYNHLSHGEYEFHIEVLDTDKETVLSKRVYNITKDTENYEKTGFIVWLCLVGVWIAISIIITTITVTVRLTADKQKADYDKALAKLEREKAQALELALHHEEQANRSKSDFLASMSHEIRTPINAIIGMDTMILRETSQNAVREYAANIKSASETLLALINDILDFSKIESGKMELVLGDYDTVGMINDLCNLVIPKAKSKNLDFQVSIDPNLPTELFGDEVRIKQIILNILNNAVKYTETGSIHMEIGCDHVSELQIAMKVRISDTGIGIKEEDLKKLFSPYERIEESRNKHVEGTGLGMSITKKLLEMMDSSLHVESVYGEGSTFSFTVLQVVKSEEVMGNFEDRMSTLGQDKEAAETYHAPKAEILVVDDVEMNLIVATGLLRRIQSKVTTASSGAAAIELCKTKVFDIVLLDSMMPELSGEDTLKIIKADCELNRETPVIVLTANAIKGAKEEYLSLGFDDYLAKPIDGAELEETLLRYLPADKVVPFDANDTTSVTGAVDTTGVTDPADGTAENNNPDDVILAGLRKISGLDAEQGMAAAGGIDTYLAVCRNFFDTASVRIEMIEGYFRSMDLPNYTIQVHALKSSARLIGAFALSEEALALEMAGRESNTDKIDSLTDHLLGEYRRIYLEMEDLFGEASADADKPELSDKKLQRSLADLTELLEVFDVETARELLESLSEYRLPEDFRLTYKQLRGRMAEVDRDGMLEILKNAMN